MSCSTMIDHTLLRPEATRQDVTALCREAMELNMASVCVNSTWVPLCAELVGESPVKVCTVVGFPLGGMSTEAKVFETRDAVANGADEIDMVMNIGWAKEGRWDAVRADIAAVVEAAGPALVKVILETCLLDDDEIVSACHAAVDGGADFVKTSTGFSSGGANVHAVTIMRECVGPDFGVKASGGIRTVEDMAAMVAAGANRIGASAGQALLEGEQ